MALFALMDTSVATRILRIQLDSTASSSVDSIFIQQAKHFESHHSSVIPFHAGYSPRYNECFEITNFIDSSILIDAISRPTAIPVWDPTKIDIDNIKALFLGVKAPSNPKKIAIQTFNKKQILDTSKSFIMGLISSRNTFSKAASVGFNIDDKLVAIIDDDKIKFQSFFKLRSVFNMTSYFTEATDNDLDAFSNQSIFSLSQGFDLKSVADTVIRSKVTLINKTGVLTPTNLPKFKAEAQRVNFALKTTITNGIEQIVMPNTKKEIKDLLDFLEEDIFISGISGRRFKAGSKRPI